MNKSKRTKSSSSEKRIREENEVQVSNVNTLDGWLTKDKSKMKSCNKQSKLSFETKPEKIKHKKCKVTTSVSILSEEFDCDHKSSDTIKSSSNSRVSESFARYGIRIPTFEDIVKDQENYKYHKTCIENINPMEHSLEITEKSQLEEQPVEIVLDCKHLSISDIDQAFKNNYQYIANIFHGIQYSDRHERFYKGNSVDHFTRKDLRYNTSMSVFTYEQKQRLLKRMQKKFDGSNPLEFTQYYFKVLLPELCLKIFMDVHNMNVHDAVAYLDVRPIEDKD